MSPLHYHHGCLGMKGGKVVGQGFNNYRLDPPSSKSNSKTEESIIGSCGGRCHANARLTIHSRMMATNSALLSHSTLAASTVSHIAPCFKFTG
ncbi:hypothetical protein VP1G_10839 [Cytospora mali]|uniref:Uncharacterized protein n=1 Tax=Cytospora mali TaxID=578113 RepID=A0A194UX33_CYTMA|nr:hypothetical protein VP1G_10839 [Valsa mali var. pyri (nom. inval.)]